MADSKDFSASIDSNAKKSPRRIGVPTKRLSSLRWRMSTRAKPMPHMPEFIRFIPSKPGIKKSI